MFRHLIFSDFFSLCESLPPSPSFTSQFSYYLKTSYIATMCVEHSLLPFPHSKSPVLLSLYLLQLHGHFLITLCFDY